MMHPTNDSIVNVNAIKRVSESPFRNNDDGGQQKGHHEQFNHSPSLQPNCKMANI